MLARSGRSSALARGMGASSGGRHGSPPLQRCGLLLDRTVFAHGQLYVGMSRVGDPDQLQVFIPPKSDGISVCGKRNITVNTVYKEALSQHNT